MNLFVPSVYSTVMLSLPSTQAVGGQHREGGIPQLAGHKPQRTPRPPSETSPPLVSLCSLLSKNRSSLVGDFTRSYPAPCLGS